MLVKSILYECEMAAERDSLRERCDCFTSVMSPERMCDLQTQQEEKRERAICAFMSIISGARGVMLLCDL